VNEFTVYYSDKFLSIVYKDTFKMLCRFFMLNECKCSFEMFVEHFNDYTTAIISKNIFCLCHYCIVKFLLDI